MFVACVVVTVLIAVMAAASGVMKLRRAPQIVDALVNKLELPMSWLTPLAALELAGAIGALIGLAVAPLGIAAAAGLVAYFVGAAVTHVVRHDTPGIVRPLPFVALAAAALVLRIATA
jgi:hypothetical protein